MADQPQHDLLLDLLYEEDLTDEEREEAERLLEDESFQRELEDHRELLAYIRSETAPASPSDDVHDEIVDYARAAATAPGSPIDSNSDDDASTDGADVFGVSFLSGTTARTMAVAATMTAVFGLVLFLTSETSRHGSIPTETAKQSRHAPQQSDPAAPKRRAHSKNSSDAGERPARKGVGQKTEKPDATDDTSTEVATNKDIGAGEADTSVGSGKRIADRLMKRERRATDESAPDRAQEERKRAEPRFKSESSGEGTGSTSGGAELNPIESRDEGAAASEEPQRETQDSDVGAQADETDSIPSRVRTMRQSWESKNYESALSAANRLLANAASRDVEISLDDGPSRTARYFALTYKLRSLVDLERWSEARATLSVIRRHFPDADARLRTVVNRIPGQHSQGADASGTTVPASESDN